MYYINFKIQPFKHKDQDIRNQQLRVVIVATHTDMAINNRLYLPEEVQKQLASWTKPYPVPILVHHKEDTDAIGRITEQVYVTKQSQLEQSKYLGVSIDIPEQASGTVVLMGYVTDSDQIQKILSGIYKTVSVGFTCEKLECSICGEEDCEHMFGETYNGVTAYAIPRNMKYQEVSFVNVPADEYAGVISYELIPMSEVEFVNSNVPEESEQIKPPVENESELVSVTNSDVNSQLRDTLNQGGSYMEELNQLKEQNAELKQKHDDAVKQLNDLRQAYEKLEKNYNNLLDSLKDEYARRVAFLKAIILDEVKDETMGKFYNDCKDKSFEELKMLEHEFAQIAEALCDSQDKPCDGEAEQDCEQENQEEQEEAEAEEAEEDKNKDANKTKNEKDANPQKFPPILDAHTVVLNKLLGR